MSDNPKGVMPNATQGVRTARPDAVTGAAHPNNAEAAPQPSDAEAHIPLPTMRTCACSPLRTHLCDRAAQEAFLAAAEARAAQAERSLLTLNDVLNATTARAERAERKHVEAEQNLCEALGSKAQAERERDEAWLVLGLVGDQKRAAERVRMCIEAPVARIAALESENAALVEAMRDLLGEHPAALFGNQWEGVLELHRDWRLAARHADRVLSDLPAAAAERDARIRKEGFAAGHERAATLFDATTARIRAESDAKAEAAIAVATKSAQDAAVAYLRAIEQRDAAWKKGYADGLERAATICEPLMEGDGGAYGDGYEAGKAWCTTAIRAEKGASDVEA